MLVTNMETMDQDCVSSERRHGVAGVLGVTKSLIEKVMSELRLIRSEWQKDLGKMS